jgi:F0F1-type ATP synthase assembly protein I
MQPLKGVGAYGTVGLDMVLAVVVGLLGGRWLDGRFGTRGWLTVIGFMFGVAASFNILFKAAKRLREETEREDREQQRKAEQGRGAGDTAGRQGDRDDNHDIK